MVYSWRMGRHRLYPKEIAKKETLEEAGLDVIPENIIAFSDMAKRFQDFLCTRTTL